MAERGGFEPPIRFCRIHTFQACAFNHSATSPRAPVPEDVRRAHLVDDGAIAKPWRPLLPEGHGAWRSGSARTVPNRVAHPVADCIAKPRGLCLGHVPQSTDRDPTMIRLFFRFLSLAALAVAAIMAVLDATRSIAASRFVVTSLGESWSTTLPSSYALAQESARTYLHPIAWDPIALTALQLPGSVVFAVLALLFYAVGRKPRRHASGFVEI